VWDFCIYFSDASRLVEQDLVLSATNEMRHRGPDDEGVYISGNIGLGHRRLSIIDLASGHQPMFNEDGQIALVYNGEIYNHLEIREFLVKKGHIVRSLVCFEDADDEPDVKMNMLINWSEIKREFENWAKKL